MPRIFLLGIGAILFASTVSSMSGHASVNYHRTDVVYEQPTVTYMVSPEFYHDFAIVPACYEKPKIEYVYPRLIATKLPERPYIHKKEWKSFYLKE